MSPPPQKRIKIECNDNQALEPEREAENPSILSLNDDCIYEITRNLSLNDLSAMAQTCQRIHAVCSERFQRTFKDKILIINDVTEDGTLVKGPSKEKYIDVFEKKIRNVVLTKTCASKNVLQRMNSFYKLQQTIEEEGVQKVVQNIAVIKELRLESWSASLRKYHGPLIADSVQQVESLTLANIKVHGDLNEYLLKFMPNLKELRIWEGFEEPSTTNWMNQTYPKLKRFIWHSNKELPTDKLKQLLSKNSNITFLSLLYGRQDLQNTVQNLIKENIQINELFIDLPYNTTNELIGDLSVLCKKKSCRLHINFSWGLNVNLQLLASFIEGVYFGQSPHRTMMQSLSTFENLKVLQVDIAGYSDEIAAIPNLEEIYVYWAITPSNRKQYKDSISKFAIKLKTLKKIYFRCKSQQFNAKVIKKFDDERNSLTDAEVLKMYFKTDNGLDNIENIYNKIELVHVESEIVKNRFVNEYLTTKKFSNKGGRRRRFFW